MCFIMAPTLNGNHGDFDGIGRRQTIGLQLADARGSRHRDGEVARVESPRLSSRRPVGVRAQVCAGNLGASVVQ
jgi:hypothetical protein